jgi:DNA-binding transcriptional ArsR family regulator
MNADTGGCRRRLRADQVDLVVEVFRMLADATRVQVLWALNDREMSVNDLTTHVGKPAPSVSQHLAKLRMARLVRTRREGTTIFHTLENDHVAQLVTDAVSTPNTPARASPDTTATPTICEHCTHATTPRRDRYRRREKAHDPRATPHPS